METLKTLLSERASVEKGPDGAVKSCILELLDGMIADERFKAENKAKNKLFARNFVVQNMLKMAKKWHF